MKISIVTATYNSSDTVLSALESIQQQSYSNYEHILVDGKSSDLTLERVRDYAMPNQIISSEKDQGIYDALNKGIGLASGDVVGFLHSDDFFPSNDVLTLIADAFRDSSIKMCFGDLAYVHPINPTKIIRLWRAGEFSKRSLQWGWMPPHPTLYVRRDILMKNLFNLKYSISADYDQILRLFRRESEHSVYIPRELVHMRLGGESNKSFRNILTKSYEDLKALRANKVGGVATLALKNVRKIPQFWSV
jgi:glycosyltransferase